ncbi:hypothetical protein ACFW9F_28095, partial [Streptomyces sp. NPDC059506]
MNDAPRTGGYSVPSGRPHLLREVHAKLSALDDRVGALWQGADPLEFDAIADDLHAAFRSAAGLAPPRSRTGCPQHPDGAVDPEAPVGWSRCLLCNTRRRMRERVVPPPAERQNRMGYPVPEPPYTLESLNGYADADYQTQDSRLGEQLASDGTIIPAIVPPAGLSGFSRHVLSGSIYW